MIDKSMSDASEDKCPGNVREEGTRHNCSCLEGVREHEELEKAPLAHLPLCPSVSPWHGELCHEVAHGLEQVQIISYNDQILCNCRMIFDFIKIYLVGKKLVFLFRGFEHVVIDSVESF